MKRNFISAFLPRFAYDLNRDQLNLLPKRAAAER